MAADTRFLRSIRLRNILSFGPETPELELLPLNVLIGPNGSGKSNLIEGIAMLQAAPRDLLEPIRKGGGIQEWLWKGAEQTPVGRIEAKVTGWGAESPLQHELMLTMVGQRAVLGDELIDYEQSDERSEYKTIYHLYGSPILNRLEDLSLYQSVLSQRKDPDHYPEITYLGNQYAKIKLFREWNLGRNTAPRKPQSTDLVLDFLEEDAANLALVLNALEHRPGLRKSLVERLQDADGSIEDFSTKVLGGTIQLFLHYAGLKSPVPGDALIRWNDPVPLSSGCAVPSRAAAVGLSGGAGIGPSSGPSARFGRSACGGIAANAVDRDYAF